MVCLRPPAAARPSRPPRRSGRALDRRRARWRLGALVAAAWAGACGGAGDETASLSFVTANERWRATDVRASVEQIVEADGTVEHTVRLVATEVTSGEQLTFWLLAPELEGTHPVRVFGRLAGYGGVAPRPISNACSSNDPAAASGTLSLEAHDRDARLLSGSFIANVCAVGEPDTAATLGDGRFVAVPY